MQISKRDVLRNLYKLITEWVSESLGVARMKIGTGDLGQQALERFYKASEAGLMAKVMSWSRSEPGNTVT